MITDRQSIIRKWLIINSCILVCILILIVVLLNNKSSSIMIYITVNIVYWVVFCLPAIIMVSKDYKLNLRDIYRPHTKEQLLYTLISFVPMLPTFFISFLPTITQAPVTVIIIAVIYALINGLIEELYWRGLFNTVFDNIRLSYLFPTIMFSLWHISLALIQGIKYHGGYLPLVGGATFMGLLWGAVAYRTKSIRYTTIAHIATNIFAFSQLIYVYSVTL